MKKKIFIAWIILISLIICPAICFAGTDDYPAKYKNAAQDALVDEWNFFNRECTSFVAWRLNSRNKVGFTNQYKGASKWGNAKTWGTVAKSLGITVNTTPAVGAVAWWDTGTYGHVAWVEAVNGSNVTIEEYNWSKVGGYSERTISKSNPTGYIHIKDLSNPEPAPLPSNAWITASRTEIEKGQSVTFNFGISNVKHCGIGLDKDGKRYYTIEATGKNTATYTFNETGTYNVVCEGYNSDGKMGYSNWLKITVYDTGQVPLPSDAWITSDKTVITKGSTVNFNFGISHVEHSGIGIDKDGHRYYTIEATGKGNASYTFNETGTYSIVCEGYNSKGKMGYSNWLKIRVYDTLDGVDAGKNVPLTSNVNTSITTENLTLKNSVSADIANTLILSDLSGTAIFAYKRADGTITEIHTSDINIPADSKITVTDSVSTKITELDNENLITEADVFVWTNTNEIRPLSAKASGKFSY